MDDDAKIVAIMPGGGWFVEYTEDGQTWTHPIVGWGLRADGRMVPLDTDTSGEVFEIKYADGVERRLWHPSAEPPSGLSKEG